MGNKHVKIRNRRTHYGHPHRHHTGVNHAVVFIKPHACNAQVEKFVKHFLQKHHIRIEKTEVKTSEKLKELIDYHYSTIANAAMKTPPQELAVTEEHKQKFKDAFGVDWDDAIREKKVLNIPVYEKVNKTPSLKEAWDKKETQKVGIAQGIKIARIPSSIKNTGDEEEIHYVINGFYEDMRNQYVQPRSKVICFAVSFKEKDLSWKRFRQEVIGSTNPKSAKKNSLRAELLEKYKDLGIEEEPSYAHNGVHASAGPIEGLYERLLWFGLKLEEDPFGAALLEAEVDRAIIELFLQNKEITLYGTTDTTFNFTEELDSSQCIRHALALQEDEPELIL